MGKLKVGDKVAIYDVCRYVVTVLEIDNSDNTVLVNLGAADVWVHEKQCRRLVKRKKECCQCSNTVRDVNRCIKCFKVFDSSTFPIAEDKLEALEKRVAWLEGSLDNHYRFHP